MSSCSIVSRPAPSRLIANKSLGAGWYVLTLEEPQIAAAARPGQFVQIRCSDGGAWDPLLRRPFSVYRVDRDRGTYDILYVEVGRGTRWMAALLDARTSGDPSGLAPRTVDVEGPFGNSFTMPGPDTHVYLVGGGVGVAPLYFHAVQMLGESAVPDMTLCMGARTRSLLKGLEDFRQLPLRAQAATDDGSEGYSGRVTELLGKLLDEEKDLSKVRLYGCGPQGMNDSLRELALQRGVACEICLESLMACGFGICFGCVAPIRREANGEFYNRRICWEGPVFDARLLHPGIDGIH